MTKINIVFNITHKDGTSKKVPVLTDVTVRIADKAFAFATLGGKYSEDQARKEFKKNPSKFVPQPDYTRDDVTMYAMVV